MACQQEGEEENGYEFQYSMQIEILVINQE